MPRPKKVVLSESVEELQNEVPTSEESKQESREVMSMGDFVLFAEGKHFVVKTKFKQVIGKYDTMEEGEKVLRGFRR